MTVEQLADDPIRPAERAEVGHQPVAHVRDVSGPALPERLGERDVRIRAVSSYICVQITLEEVLLDLASDRTQRAAAATLA